MNPKGQEDPGEDLTSRVGAESPCSDMKRAAAKKLIERYFYQLTDGCGNPQCDNQNCASSGKVTNLTPNQAAAQAIQLFSQEARLCDGTQPSKVPRTSLESGPASLAKSLPPKSMNPSCSVEGTKNASVQISFPPPTAPQPSPSYCAVDLGAPSTSGLYKKDLEIQTNPLIHQEPLYHPAFPPNRGSKRKIKCLRLENSPSSSEDSSDFAEVMDDLSEDSLSSESIQSISIPTAESLETIISDNDISIPKTSRKRQAKKINRNIIPRKAPRKRKSRRTPIKQARLDDVEPEESNRDAVAELIVLALYLRYLESKKYSNSTFQF